MIPIRRGTIKGMQTMNRQTDIVHDVNARATTYILSGKVLPERHRLTPHINLGFPPHSWEAGCTISSCEVLVKEGDITAVLRVDRPLSDIATAKNTIQHRFQETVDLQGFLLGRKFVVVFTSGFQIIHEGPGEIAKLSFDQNYIPVLDPITEGITIDKLVALINRHPRVRSAFSDLGEAFGDVFDAGFHAYRAIEIIRLEFEEASDGQDTSKSWCRLRKVLGIKREDIDFVNEFSKNQRHGRQVHMSSEDLDKCIEVAAKIIVGFAQKYDQLS